MARAEAINAIGESGCGEKRPRPRHSTCGMEQPGAFHTWPSSPKASLHLHQASAPSLPPQHLHNWDNPHTHQPLFVLLPSPRSTPSLNCDLRHDERGTRRAPPGAFSGECSEELWSVRSRRGPLPDLLLQNEHPSWAAHGRGTPMGEGPLQMEVRRVGIQLRAVGDQLNVSVLRVHGAPHWRNWRDACRDLLTFVAQTLSSLFRLM